MTGVPAFFAASSDSGIPFELSRTKKQAGKVDPPQQHPDRGHDHPLDEGRDDLAEGRTDDDADGQIDDIAAGDEIPEFLQHTASSPGRESTDDSTGSSEKAEKYRTRPQTVGKTASRRSLQCVTMCDRRAYLSV
jgi:hypothetical protein